MRTHRRRSLRICPALTSERSALSAPHPSDGHGIGLLAPGDWAVSDLGQRPAEPSGWMICRSGTRPGGGVSDNGSYVNEHPYETPVQRRFRVRPAMRLHNPAPTSPNMRISGGLCRVLGVRRGSGCPAWHPPEPPRSHTFRRSLVLLDLGGQGCTQRRAPPLPRKWRRTAGGPRVRAPPRFWWKRFRA